MAGGRRPPPGAVDLRITGRYAMLLDGRLSVEELDDEELARCQLKDKNGKFTGRPPKALPAELVRRMKQEFFRRGDDIFEKGYVEAVETMLKIMRQSDDDAIRLKAAQYVVERVRGKTPDKVVVEGDQAAWAVIASKIFVDARSLENIVDAEVLEDDGDP